MTEREYRKHPAISRSESMERNMSVETVKRHRCRAYHKIAQELFIPLP